MSKINDITNRKFGKLTVIKDFGRIEREGRKKDHIVLAVCECGVEKEYISRNLLKGTTLSCGCLHNPGNTKHGLYHHPLYKTWWSMGLRCYNKNSNNYGRYGGKGVVMCDEWRSDFMSFYNWAIVNGWQHGLEIDKDIKGDGLLYSPEVCVIVTPKQNSRKRKSNTHYTYNGQTKILIEWAEAFNMSYKKLHGRIKRLKWSIEKALTTP